MSRGYVYILSNPAMPGIVKIGRTERSVEGRAKELRTTGVPFDFVVEYYQLFPDAPKAEGELHATFQEFRLSESREFFSVSATDVIAEIDGAIKRQVQDIINVYFVDAQLVEGEDKVALDLLSGAASKVGASTIATAAACCQVEADTLWGLVERTFEKMATFKDDAA